MSAVQFQQTLPSTIPLRRGDESLLSGSSIVAVLLLFAILIAVWAAVRRTRVGARNEDARRLAGWLGAAARRDSGVLRVVESRRLSSHSVLHVVDYEGRRLLLADSVHGVRCLAGDHLCVANPGNGEASDVA